MSKRTDVVNVEEYLTMEDKKLKVENELRFFKSDFAKMVLAKEETLSQLNSAKQVVNTMLFSGSYHTVMLKYIYVPDMKLANSCSI